MKTGLKIEGMSCDHCVSAVTTILKEVAGVKKVIVSLEDKAAVVSGNIDKEQLINAFFGTPYKGA